MLWAFFSYGNLSLFLRILNWAANESKILSLSDQSLEGRVSDVSAWRVRVRSSEGTILGERMWCLADIEASSAKTEGCDC